MTAAADPVSVLRRWEDAGGIWRVLGRRGAELTVSLCTCTGGEEVDRLVSAEPAVREYVGDRLSNKD